jgi:hypothetical protein
MNTYNHIFILEFRHTLKDLTRALIDRLSKKTALLLEVESSRLDYIVYLLWWQALCPPLGFIVRIDSLTLEDQSVPPFIHHHPLPDDSLTPEEGTSTPLGSVLVHLLCLEVQCPITWMKIKVNMVVLILPRSKKIVREQFCVCKYTSNEEPTSRRLRATKYRGVCR